MIPALTLFAFPALALDLSSTTISEPHALVRGQIQYSTAHARLPVFPESLVFDVSWGLLSVGQATLSVEDVVDFGGRPAYHIVSRAVSNKFCDAFYKVRDLNESWLDAHELTGLGYSKKLREGHFLRDEWVLYDGKGHWLSKTTNSDGSYHHRTGTAPLRVQDVLSSIYFVRAQELKEGAEIVVDVNTRETWPLVVKVIKKESVKVPAGKFEAWLVEPMLRQEGIFIQKGKRLRLWLTADERKTPVMMKVEVFFGHITAKLRHMAVPDLRTGNGQ